MERSLKSVFDVSYDRNPLEREVTYLISFLMIKYVLENVVVKQNHAILVITY